MGNHSRHHVYISGPLTDVPPSEREDLKALYENIGAVCERFGFSAYIPHQRSDPHRHSDLTPEEVDALDRAAVTQSALVIAYVDRPSLGVGIELEMAFHANKKVILTYHEGTRVSRLALGNPSVLTTIIFSNRRKFFEDLGNVLTTFIEQHFPRHLP